jgi:uncharacterized linocin/CFP29 family protein
MDFLKRAQAPITSEAWSQIDEVITRMLRAQLSGRKVVDVEGPRGLQTAAVNLGRLEIPTGGEKGEVRYGINRVLPLIEARARFALDIWELDNVARGAADVDLAPAEKAARRIAAFEDGAIFNGFAPGGIGGLTQTRGHEAIPLPMEPGGFLDAVARAMLALQDEAIGGPYRLVLGQEPFRFLATQFQGYPLKKQIENLLGSQVLYSHVVEGGLMISRRGGDTQLVLGQDLAVGYESHDRKSVQLFITESFTFRVLEAVAVVRLPLGKPRARARSR